MRRERDAFDGEVEPEPFPRVAESTATLVVNRKNLPLADDLVPITRGTPFGNPYPITKARTRDAAIEAFRTYFLDRVATDLTFREQVLALKGKTLVCVCKPLPCHGDVIAGWLDGPEAGKVGDV